ncbi:major facilitator superfamily multidrug-resistance, DHA1 sub-family [Mycena alexandri]|uniref:Major facilitator superfamily multidrug-resistance, DHA1 sub-family n=1 Tax=Mycena alexandri TaxID=1745969 RepID=A0AAD6WZJ2_9AGAR|nr:major facilitator superfamily multidrug-resistance, DHA1 sub-family [Mycena alexandri]
MDVQHEDERDTDSLFLLILIQFSEPVTALVIYPFIIQFVRDTGVTGGDETRTGYFAGIIESIFFLAECLTVVWFGRASDRYGRRPILLIGPVGLALSMLGFGLSKRFWSLVVFRCLQGAFNGNIGKTSWRRCGIPIEFERDLNTYSQISDSTNVAEIYSFLPFMWTIGATFGPFIGGSLANPAIRFPDSLGKIHLLREFPYLLPCATAGALAFSAFVLGFLGLKETLPSAIAHHKKRAAQAGTESEPLLVGSNHPTGIDDAPPPLRDLFVRPVFIALTNHGFLAFSQMAYEVLVPLVYATPIALGGLGLSPLYIGRIMGSLGLVNVLTQIFFSARAIRHFGPRTIFITAFCWLSCSFLAYPLLNYFARRSGRVDGHVIAVMLFQMSSSLVIFPTFACTQIFVVDSAPTQNSLGGVNGLAQMVASTLRSVAPTFAASLFATSVSHDVLGGNMVFFVLCGISVCGVRAALMLPRKLRSEGDE